MILLANLCSTWTQLQPKTSLTEFLQAYVLAMEITNNCVTFLHFMLLIPKGVLRNSYSLPLGKKLSHREAMAMSASLRKVSQPRQSLTRINDHLSLKSKINSHPWGPTTVNLCLTVCLWYPSLETRKKLYPNTRVRCFDSTLVRRYVC